jgi:hypothetical protein
VLSQLLGDCARFCAVRVGQPAGADRPATRQHRGVWGPAGRPAVRRRAQRQRAAHDDDRAGVAGAVDRPRSPPRSPRRPWRGRPTTFGTRPCPPGSTAACRPPRRPSGPGTRSRSCSGSTPRASTAVTRWSAGASRRRSDTPTPTTARSQVRTLSPHCLGRSKAISARDAAALATALLPNARRLLGVRPRSHPGRPQEDSRASSIGGRPLGRVSDGAPAAPPIPLARRWSMACSRW